MLKEILRFELAYRKKRSATYIYFAILFLMSFFAVTSKYIVIGGVAGGQIVENSPYNLSFMTVIMTFAMTFIVSAIMGVPVLRDFDHKTDSMLFTTPVSKFAYLFGRFFGSFVVTVLVFSAVWVAFMLGFAVGKYLPWEPSWAAKEMLPFNFWHYIQPFLTLGITNLFIQAALYFAAGTLSRQTIVIYVQGIVLLVLYQIADTVLEDIDNKTLAAMLDPFGFRAFQIYTEYWSPAQKNSQLVPLEGVLLWNRLLWLGLAGLILAGTYFGFSFSVVRKGWRKAKAAVAEKVTFKPENVRIPTVRQVLNAGSYLTMLWQQAKFYFKITTRDVPFIGIVAVGLINLIVSSFYFGEMYGTGSYPITANVLGLLDEFDLFFLIIVIFYSGELIWRERSVNMNLIMDALPVPDWVNLVAKFIGLVMVYVLLLLVLIVMGMGVQAAHGYFNFEIPLYVKSLFTSTLFFLVAYTLLAFFIQVMANDKFIGYGLMFVFFIVTFTIGAMGVSHPMFMFNSGNLGDYSDMNRYGHFVARFSWLKFYWFTFVCILFSLSVVFAVRGSEAVMRTRLRLGRLRLTRPLVTFALTTIIAFTGTGFYVYYNTNQLNKYRTQEEGEQWAVDYEKTLKKFNHLPQPKIVESNLRVELYPDERDFTAEGYFWLKNKTEQPLADVHIQEDILNDVQTEYLRFGNGDAQVKQRWEKYGYTIYTLAQPLAPGDSVKMDFKVNFTTRGFTAGGGNTSIVQNGTFFNNTYFPSIGYAEAAELGDDDLRRKYKLPEKERMMEQTDPRGLSQSLFGDDADYIRFQMIIGTSPDQIAIAPGYLQKEWEEKGRKYYHYQMDIPMVNFYSIVSARYEVKRDQWKSADGQVVNLEIYYNKGHEYNLEQMMTSAKKSLGYFSANFSPYQFRQLRIMEFPRYASFAQSFANTVPFSEGIGFIQKVSNPEKDLDMPYYVTAHEIGHQWWGHQVPEASVKGNAMLSETQAQYSALMVMKHSFTPELMQKFLKYEVDKYLQGRAMERKKEQPLVLVEGQGYIHYNKGSVIMYALQDYIGEANVNTALRNFLADWQYPGPDSKPGRYPTSRDLLGYFRAETPDSLQYLIDDWFEHITLYENKTTEATYVKQSDTKYEVTLKFSSEKYRADSAGNDTPQKLAEWIDVGVYGKDKADKDSLLYLQKHKITKQENVIKVSVPKVPTKAGIDPLNKLIDRHPDDNTKTVSQAETTS
ncbi:M1 family aminopeptidase [Rhabdobacter roseus]|uniref:ABC-type transport system involved in multi-copper enzyme maturation permease subunit n=1 Tax=Rhabdobacter roseus TaxID=1655419 RepID=A0A840U030_9BACT|nr:M1 family aminopeptidase [Rhabdobacter roseus]MBB5286893.1 ABC-type transport system involved in multi-copper enzyme maturation permease subunit [Rhabdobacter roseus]